MSTEKLHTPQHLLLQKFKEATEDRLPSLNQALHRAAAFGTVEDINDLVTLGANINSQDDEKKRSPLHCAVFSKTIENIKALLKYSPDLDITDCDGKTASDYACLQDDIAIKELIAETTEPALQIDDVVKVVLKKLPLWDMQTAKQVRRKWNKVILGFIDEVPYKLSLSDLERKTYNDLPKSIKYVIKKIFLENNNTIDAHKFFILLSLDKKSLAENIDPVDPSKLHGNPQFSSIVGNKFSLALYAFGLLSIENIMNYPELSSPYGILMLTDGFLSKGITAKFPNDQQTHNKLKSLLNKTGYLALKEKLITEKDVKELPELSVLLTDTELQALREGILLIADIKASFDTSEGRRNNLSLLLSKQGLDALRKKHISPEQARYISDFKKFISDDFVEIMQSGLIDLSNFSKEQMKSFSLFLDKINFPSMKKFLIVVLQQGIFSLQNFMQTPSLVLFLSEKGLKAIQEGFLLPEQIPKIKDLQFLSSEVVLGALIEGLIGISDILSMNYVEFLKSPKAIDAIKTGLISLKQFQYFISRHDKAYDKNISHLLSDECITALKGKFCTVEQLAHINDMASLCSKEGMLAVTTGAITFEQAAMQKSLAILRLPNAAIALKEGLITLEQAARFSNYGGTFQANSLTVLLSPPGLQALREKLITPEEATMFYHSGSISGNHDNLHILLNKIGIIALRKKLITPKDATCIPELEGIFREDVPEVITAMELSLISPLDFCYCAKYSTWGGGRPRDLKALVTQLISSHLASHREKLVNSGSQVKESALTLQRYCRGYLDRNRYSLFKDLQDALVGVTIHNLSQFNEIKILIDAGDVNIAREKFKALKAVISAKKPQSEAASSSKAIEKAEDESLKTAAEIPQQEQKPESNSANQLSFWGGSRVNVNAEDEILIKLKKLPECVQKYVSNGSISHNQMIDIFILIESSMEYRKNKLDQDKKLTAQQAIRILSDIGVIIISLKLATVGELCVTPGLVCETGFRALMDRLVSPDKVALIHDEFLINEVLLTETTLSLISDKVVNVDELIKHQDQPLLLVQLLSDRGTLLLRENTITIPQACEIVHRNIMFSRNGTCALLLGLITPVEAKNKNNLSEVKFAAYINGLVSEGNIMKNFITVVQKINKPASVSESAWRAAILQLVSEPLHKLSFELAPMLGYVHDFIKSSSKNMQLFGKCLAAIKFLSFHLSENDLDEMAVSVHSAFASGNNVTIQTPAIEQLFGLAAAMSEHNDAETALLTNLFPS